MHRRPLGKSGLSIAPLMLGGNVFGWTADEAASFAVLDAFVDAGFNAIDTANVYSAWAPGHQGGESETVIGKWIASRKSRAKVMLATKVGMLPVEGKPGLGAAQILKAAEDSLKRLQTDHIDLYFAHRDDEATPLDESLEAFSALVNSGKVRAIGASNYSAPRLAAALRLSADKSIPRYEVLQPLYNLMEREAFEGPLQQVCVAESIAVVPYYGLASGFLTGKYRSKDDATKSPRGGGVVQRYLNDKGLRVLAALDDVAARLGATQAQVALAWLMAQPSIAAPIASATSVEQVKDLAAAASLTLDAESMSRLHTASQL